MPLEANSTGCQARPVAFSTMTKQRVWRGVDPDLFRFATTERADPNVAVMTAFDRASTLDPALNIARVREALLGVGWDIPVEDDVLHRCLESFVGWGLLDVTQDHGAQYATPEEFERKNLQWSLTRRGEAAIGGLLQALDSLRHAVGLQPAVLDASPLPSRIPWRPWLRESRTSGERPCTHWLSCAGGRCRRWRATRRSLFSRTPPWSRLPPGAAGPPLRSSAAPDARRWQSSA